MKPNEMDGTKCVSVQPYQSHKTVRSPLIELRQFDEPKVCAAQ